MPENIIEVENLSKLYKIGKINTGTLSHDLNRWWSKIRKNEDPLLSEGEKNDRNLTGSSSYVWSLKDINFGVKQGEIFGVIGSNGAGKSTLFKILSKITKPTTGSIKLDGRIASLLEVGTGFHPELTGRENVFLNGAILGMKKQEIKNRFDEIVDFSGIGRYIDTPVKKYSSGMYVRLAFAVAANLEPDILIIDEVLAVGDAEFQAKCLGKMKDVSSNYGRTVLFVSHNIGAIKQLCSKGILLEQGEIKAIGSINEIVSAYQQQEPDTADGIRNRVPKKVAAYFTQWQLEEMQKSGRHACYTGDNITFSFALRAIENLKDCEVRFMLKYDGLLLLHASSLANKGHTFSLIPGDYKFRFRLKLPLRDARFDVTAIFISAGKTIDSWTSTTKLVVLDHFGSPVHAGVINPEIQFNMEEEAVMA